MIHSERCNHMCKNCLTHCEGCTNSTYSGCVRKITAEELKLLIKKHNEALSVSDAIDEEWGNHPDNEELEMRWDEAYKTEMMLYERIIDALKRITNTDTKTAKKMYDCYRNRIEDLINHCKG